MVKKNYAWDSGAVLEEHTKKKHKILTEYFRQYLKVRCAHPQQSSFKLAIVDGFSGAGLYSNGEFGSPLIFIDTLKSTIKEINLYRKSQGMKEVHIECLIVFNDYDAEVINLLRNNIAPYLAAVKDNETNLSIHCLYSNNSFEKAYEDIKGRILITKCKNVFFNLDQCGYSHVTSSLVRDVMSTWRSSEILLTFMIQSLLTYLSPSIAKNNGVPLEANVKEKINSILEEQVINKREWLGEAEKIVYQHLKGCAKYVSPFSINNPDGWQYWLMHFAASHRARQVYNDVLHCHGEAQAHYGRAGLNMLSYEPSFNQASLYLFDQDSREVSKDQLAEDIPKLISQSGDVLPIGAFYENAYSETPAHSEDIHQSIIDNPDLEVVTESGGVRRSPNTIRVDDVIRLKNQKSFSFAFND